VVGTIIFCTSGAAWFRPQPEALQALLFEAGASNAASAAKQTAGPLGTNLPFPGSQWALQVQKLGQHKWFLHQPEPLVSLSH